MYIAKHARVEWRESGDKEIESGNNEGSNWGCSNGKKRFGGD